PGEEMVQLLGEVIAKQPKGQLQWVSAGAFFPQVLYLAPVLNEYLQQLTEQVYAVLSGQPDTKIQACYRPFSWFPHTTVAKKLSAEQMQAAYAVLQKEFSPFEGQVVRIGLSETTPKREMISWNTL
nr:2'-5' RNA ligase family protein [Lachnospiraceae bacterium]